MLSIAISVRCVFAGCLLKIKGSPHPPPPPVSGFPSRIENSRWSKLVRVSPIKVAQYQSKDERGSQVRIAKRKTKSFSVILQSTISESSYATYLGCRRLR
mmetsp:Transcript_16723/g.34430  ORF Transcript_16723/g.34430 Transcript_16723/m.34430 type:complete len:100 (-) Transcript_16723:239-538(-)